MISVFLQQKDTKCRNVPAELNPQTEQRNTIFWVADSFTGASFNQNGSIHSKFSVSSEKWPGKGGGTEEHMKKVKLMDCEEDISEALNVDRSVDRRN